MLIGVLSDSHRNIRMVDRVFSIFKELGVDCVFHLGDVTSDVDGYDTAYGMPVYTVPGNMDYSRDSTERSVDLDGVRFFLAHGHTLGVIYTRDELIESARDRECQVALYGHTHVPFLSREEGILIMNPGSVTEPRKGSSRSFGLIRIKDGKAEGELRSLTSGS